MIPRLELKLLYTSFPVYLESKLIMRKLLPILALVSSAALAHAATIISVTGTVSHSTSSAYTDGSIVTITYTLADYSVTGDPSNAMDQPNEFDWYQYDAPYNPIYSDVDLTGATGNFVNPSGAATEMYLYMNRDFVPGGTYIMADAGASSGYPASEMGISVGSDYVSLILLGFQLTDTYLDGLGAANTNPEQYLSTVYGTYAATATDASYVAFVSGDRFDFTPSSVTIGAVPEPSVCGMLGAATALLGLRRRRK
jgi:hypothetical protein